MCMKRHIREAEELMIEVTNDESDKGGGVSFVTFSFPPGFSYMIRSDSARASAPHLEDVFFVKELRPDTNEVVLSDNSSLMTDTVRARDLTLHGT